MTNPEKTKLTTQPPRGTQDILPGESDQWQQLELLARNVLKSAGYKEIRLPMFEQTELFCRTAGEDSDVVGKEMYTFQDKSGRSLTLRPEGTAQAARAYLNSSMERLRPPTKLFYMGPFFRCEAVQTGRYRQFNQLGLEAFGSASPLLDAEVIAIACDFLAKAGLAEFEVHINSIGCASCRPRYREALKLTLQDRLPNLCQDCCNRFERNPLRMPSHTQRASTCISSPTGIVGLTIGTSSLGKTRLTLKPRVYGRPIIESKSSTAMFLPSQKTFQSTKGQHTISGLSGPRALATTGR